MSGETILTVTGNLTFGPGLRCRVLVWPWRTSPWPPHRGRFNAQTNQREDGQALPRPASARGLRGHPARHGLARACSCPHKHHPVTVIAVNLGPGCATPEHIMPANVGRTRHTADEEGRTP